MLTVVSRISTLFTINIASITKCKINALNNIVNVQKQSGFLEGQLFSSKSELDESFLNCSDWLDNTQPSKKVHFIMDM